jgi:hypothetical protein
MKKDDINLQILTSQSKGKVEEKKKAPPFGSLHFLGDLK